ncbi:hypothetical protein L227DRAFT_160471 [Lentinus tigrinus ALCF2SS1-6]|uniref:Uncharacterized protein n=1 Tax=Lentinus tigrinus ALCF2SS1-6 TaxID=1328759 RepID=A0A5C2SDJ6_9APHY|nr:hypothetical protein L227DRAFT_160471 [Lentinus tigrinus ALCF2SS1-6]
MCHSEPPRSRELRLYESTRVWHLPCAQVSKSVPPPHMRARSPIHTHRTQLRTQKEVRRASRTVQNQNPAQPSAKRTVGGPSRRANERTKERRRPATQGPEAIPGQEQPGRGRSRSRIYQAKNGKVARRHSTARTQNPGPRLAGWLAGWEAEDGDGLQ